MRRKTFEKLKTMKAIILISSIFYILGLKIGNKIDIVKKSHPIEKIITNGIKTSKPLNAFHIEQKEDENAKPDSLKSEKAESEILNIE